MKKIPSKKTKRDNVSRRIKPVDGRELPFSVKREEQ
jgi:hypothetical protein